MPPTIAKTATFCVCGVHLEPGEQIEMRNGSAVHLACRDRTPNAQLNDPATWTLTPTPAPAPVQTARVFTQMSGDYGPTGEPSRLMGQRERAFELLSDGEWWPVADLAAGLGCLEPTAGTRARDLRKPAYGKHDVRCRRGERGREYRLVLNNLNGAIRAA